MRAIIHLRQSLDRDGTGAAVERQREDCERLCAERGWDVVQVVNENDTSATNGDREKFAAMLAAIENGEADVIVAWHVDRLTRKLTELEALIELAERTGVRIATVTGDVDLSTDAGRLVGRILASVARGEIERKSARQKRAAVQAAEQGRLPGGPPPFGWRKDGTHDPVQADHLRDAYRQILAGATLKGIALDWNRRGIESSPGRTAWNHTTLRRRLLDPRNAALRALNGVVVGEGDWQPIVDTDTYEAVKARLTAASRRTTTGHARLYLLPGLALCGLCGVKVITGRSGRGTRTYACPTRHMARVADPVDDYVSRVVIARLSRPDAIELLRRDDAPDRDALTERAAVLRQRLDDIATALAEGVLMLDGARRESKRLRAELDEVEARLHEPTRAAVLMEMVEADDPARMWDALDLGRRRAVIDTLMIVTLHPTGRGTRTFRPESVGIDWRS
ncbi:MAG: recombinase family protein [Nocardioidaceae bacterium]